MSRIRIIGTLLILMFLATSASAANVSPGKSQVTNVLQNYNLSGQNNSLQLACEIGQYVSEEYGWNCDIRQLNFTKHVPVYINVFYPAADNKKGYEAYYGWFGPQRKEVIGFLGKDKAMYYRDWGSDAKAGCRISGVCSYGIVKSYFGNISEDNTTNPVIVPEESSTIPIVIENNSHDEERINNENITNSAENSTNTANNQGYIDTLKQYFFDLSGTNWSNVSFNFWS